MVFESGSTTIISFAPWANAPSMVCGTWISCVHCSAPIGVAVQRVDDGIAALLVLLVAGRQEDNHIAIDGVAFQIAFQSCAVNLDVLHRDGLCARHDGGNVGLHLGRSHDPGAIAMRLHTQ